MNFYASTSDGNHAGEFSLIHADSHHADAIVVPDAELLFTGSFHRSGPDLILTGHDGRHHVVAGYFSSEHPPALMAPNGAHLSPDVVDLLAGSPAPNEYAQAQTQVAAPPDSIGKVQKVAGTVSVLRNGVSIAINVGDVVYKSDIVVTGADSKVGVTFPDGTALELLPNTRMALTEYSYNPNGNSNSALFTYVTGTFGFFAGKVAHTGDMKIETPVATMGIRGTTGVMGQDTDASGNVIFWQVIYDDPGTNVSGSWDDFLRNADGTIYLGATVSQTNFMTLFTLRRGLPPLVTTVPITDSYADIGREIIQELTELLNQGVNPHSIGGHPGSGDNPLLVLPPNFLPPNFGTFGPFTYNYQPPALPPLPTPPQIPPPFVPPPPSPPGTTPTAFIWPKGNNTWDTGPNWLPGFSPVLSFDSAIIESGIVTYPSSDNYTIFSLTIDGPGELHMVGGTLTVTNELNVAGLLKVGGDPPIFIASGLITIESGGKIESIGLGSFVELVGTSASDPATVGNFGTIAAKHGGNVTFHFALVTNEAPNASNTDPDTTTRPGRIISIGHDSIVDFDHSDLDNAGIVAAKHYGGVFFVNSSVTNEATGDIEAKHHGAVTFSGTDVTNYGAILAEFAGKITFDSLSQVINKTGGEIDSLGRGSSIAFSGNEIDNFGVIGAAYCGVVKFTGETIVNEASNTSVTPTVPAGKIEAAFGGAIKIDQGNVTNGDGAFIDASHGGEVDLHNAFLLNDAGGKVEAVDGGLILIHGASGSVTNLGTIDAKNFGEVVFDKLSGVANEDGGKIVAKDYGVVLFEDTSVTNYDQTTGQGGGLIEADGCGAIVELAAATIIGGTLQTRHGGKIETVYGSNTFLNVTINGAIVQVDCRTSLALDGGTSGIAAVIDKTVIFEGPGVVTMAYQSYEIVAGANGGTLINDTTMTGLGQIGVGDGALTFVNEGLLKAHLIGPNHGNEFIIDTGRGEGSATTINSGTLEAVAHAKLLIEDTTVDNTDGTVAAHGRGAVVDLVNSTFSGGTFTTGNLCDGKDGTIEILSPDIDGTNTVVFDGSAQKVTVDGFVQVDPGATLELIGSIDNNGTIDVDGPLFGADLQIDGTVKLDGSGVVTLVGSGDVITGVAGSDAKLKNYSTITGNGSIGDGDNTLTLINETKGAIVANGGEGGSLVIATGKNAIINDGLLEAAWLGVLDTESKLDNSGRVIATHSGVVAVEANVVNEVGGLIEAKLGSLITLDDIKVTNDAGGEDVPGGLIEAKGEGSGVSIAESSVDNAGTIEAKKGGAVIINDTTIHNSAGLIKSAGLGSVVELVGTKVIDGNISIVHEGTLDIEGTSATTLDGVDVTMSRNGNIEIGAMTTSGSILMLDHGTTIAGGTLTIESNSQLDVESSTGASLNGVDVVNNGTINVDYEEETPTVPLTLANGTTISSGVLSVGNKGLLDIESTSGATLDGVEVDVGRHGNIDIGAFTASGSILMLDDGTTITGGMLTIESGSQLDIEATTGATLDGVNVVNYGIINVDCGDETPTVTLMLDHGTTITGGMLSIGNVGVLDIETNAGAVFDGVDVDVSKYGHVEIGTNSGATLTIEDTVTFDGSGIATLDNQHDHIVGAGDGATLENFITIAGEGTIGDGEGSLSLVNEQYAVIDANGNKPLILDAGTTIDNYGTLEASHGGVLQIDDAVNNFNGGNALIQGGKLIFESTTNVNDITFDNGGGTPNYGELVLGDVSGGFSATIHGFAGTAPNLAHSDGIYLTDFFITSESETTTASGTVVTWDLHDGSDAVSLTFDNLSGTLNFAADAHGTLITDPPPASSDTSVLSPVTTDDASGIVTFDSADSSETESASVTPNGADYIGSISLGQATESNGSASVNWQFSVDNDQINLAPGETLTQSYNVSLNDAQIPAAAFNQTVAVSIGGAGNDNFVFAPGVGADSIVNFKPQHDTIELDHFSNAQTIHELQSLITSDAHGDAFINLGNHDSIAVEGLTAAQLQANLQNLVHLH